MAPAQVQFTIGAKASFSDGSHGKVTRLIVDPVAEAITHLAVEPVHRLEYARLVPLDLVDATDGQVRIRCTRADFDKLDPAEDTRFLTGAGLYGQYTPGQVGFLPYFALTQGGAPGAEIMQSVTFDAVPKGEVDVQRCDPVQATDGDIGHVEGLAIDRATGHVTHVLLQEGHLWGRRVVAIPISAVTSTTDGIRLNISKHEVENLPPVNVDQPAIGTAS
jgi:hypothetical protein